MRAWRHAPSTLGQAVVLLASGLVFLLSRTGWSTELDWALNWALGCTILMGPATAGLAAWSVSRDYSRSMQRLSWTLLRGHRYPVHLALRTWLCAMVAWTACVLIAATAALAGGSTRITLNALALLDGPAVLAACAALGACMAAIFRSVAAAPISAALVYVIALTTSRSRTSRALWDGGATASLRSLTPNIDVLIGSIALNTAIAVTLLSLTTLITTPRTSWRVGRVSAVVIGVIAATLALVLPHGNTYYTLTTGPEEDPTAAVVARRLDGGHVPDEPSEGTGGHRTLSDARLSRVSSGSTEPAVDAG